MERLETVPAARQALSRKRVAGPTLSSPAAGLATRPGLC